MYASSNVLPSSTVLLTCPRERRIYSYPPKEAYASATGFCALSVQAAKCR